jgi:deazaflavin-dependent oxidoreductase (nitroreductase family)
MPTPLGNSFMKTLIYSPLHPLLGGSLAVITVTGRKTGNLISTPINTVCIEGVQTVISLRSRTWWRNLRAGSLANLRQAGQSFPMRAEVVETPADVSNWLKKYFNHYPGHAKYYKIRSGPDGTPDRQVLERVARERVIIHLYPV